MNKTVTASGMKVNAVAEGSIIITGTSSLPSAGTKTTDYNFSDTTATQLYSSTHSTTYETHSTGLKKIDNADLINPETGSALNSESTLSYSVANNGGNIVYYKDYSVYIAGDGQEFSNQDITVTLTGLTEKNINKAISVDFYCESVTTKKDAEVNSDNYKGTLNLAGKENGSDDKTVANKANIKIESVDIPAAGSGAYAVTMRVYYDGNLIETPGINAYTAYQAATGNAEAGKYYYKSDDGVGIANVNVGDSVEGLFVVDDLNSTKRYARTTEIANIQEVTLTVTFAATTHTDS